MIAITFMTRNLEGDNSKEANLKMKQRADTKQKAKNMKSNNFYTESNREKLSIKYQANGQDS